MVSLMRMVVDGKQEPGSEKVVEAVTMAARIEQRVVSSQQMPLHPDDEGDTLPSAVYKCMMMPKCICPQNYVVLKKKKA